jgi:hypothetical protein
MTKKIPKSHTLGKQEFLKLAKELRTETGGAETILNRLKQLNTALHDKRTADSGPRAFLREGGLPTVIRLLRGTATSDSTPTADSLSFAISEQAGQVVTAFSSSKIGKAEIGVAKGVIPLLVDALRDAPDILARISAAHGLLVIAQARPIRCKAMVEEGVVGLLLRLLNELGKDLTRREDIVWPLWGLASDLLQGERIAMRQCRQAILGPEADIAFTALLVLQVGQ